MENKKICKNCNKKLVCSILKHARTDTLWLSDPETSLSCITWEAKEEEMPSIPQGGEAIAITHDPERDELLEELDGYKGKDSSWEMCYLLCKAVKYLLKNMK